MIQMMIITAHFISFSLAHSVNAVVRFNLDDVALSAVFTADMKVDDL